MLIRLKALVFYLEHLLYTIVPLVFLVDFYLDVSNTL